MRARSSAVSARSPAPSASAQTLAGSRPDQGDDVVPARQDPRDRGLGDGGAPLPGDAAQRLDQRQVAVEVLALEAGGERAEVAPRQCALAAPVAAQQAPRQHSVGRDADAQLAADREDLVLDAPRQQRVLDLQVGDGVDGGGPPDRLGADLGQPDVAHVARLDHLGDRADGLLDRDGRIESRRPVDVDVVRAQAAQGVREEVLDGLRSGVDAEPRPLGVAQRAELDAEEHVVAPPVAQGARDQQLVPARAVEVAGVEQGDAGIDRGVDGRDGLALVRRPVEVGHAHASQPDGRGRRARRPEPSRLHLRLLPWPPGR